MEKLWHFTEKFMESDFSQAMLAWSKYRGSDEWFLNEMKRFGIFFLLPVCAFFLYISIKYKIEDIVRKKGTYLKEKTIDELRIENSEKNSISLAFRTKKVKTKDAKEAETSYANNQKLKLDICKAVAAKIPENEICLVARSGSVYKRRDEGEIKPEAERARSFRLDLCHSWEKKKNDEWLAGYKTLKNKEGHIIGIYGADEKVIENGYEIYVPKAKEEELESMTLTELLKFCEAENCKMQIREKGSVYTFSEISGYTKEDATREISSVAEKNGIKVKIKKKGKNK